jgi:LmbE family N-acetylglucosaminyl deacetylase
LPRVPHLYFVDPIEGHDRDRRPQPVDFHVDVTDVFPIKRAMLACHASQRDWLLKHHGIDEYLDSQSAWGKRRGAEVGVEQAEGFRQYVGHAYPEDNFLLQLLGQDGRGNSLGGVIV